MAEKKGTYLVKNDINLFYALKEQNKKSAEKVKASNGRAVIALIVLLPALAMSVWFSYLMNQESMADSQIEDLRVYLENPLRQELYLQKQVTQQNTIRLENYNRTCGGYYSDLESADRLTQENFRQIEGLLPQGITITGWQFVMDQQDTSEAPVESEAYQLPATTGKMQVTAETANKDAPALFAKQLSESGLFQQVQYDGFTSDTTAKIYHFTITCVLW